MSQANQTKTVLGQDCRIKGELALDNDAVIMGEFDGILRVSGLLDLAATAKVSGTIIAGAVRLAGYADADIVALEGLEVLPEAQLVGKVFTGRLNVADGAVFQGQVCVGPEAITKAQEVIDGVAQVSELADGDMQPVAAPQQQSEMVDEYEDEAEVAGEDAQVRESSLDAMLQRRRRAAAANA